MAPSTTPPPLVHPSPTPQVRHRLLFRQQCARSGDIIKNCSALFPHNWWRGTLNRKETINSLIGHKNEESAIVETRGNSGHRRQCSAKCKVLYIPCRSSICKQFCKNDDAVFYLAETRTVFRHVHNFLYSIRVNLRSARPRKHQKLPQTNWNS